MDTSDAPTAVEKVKLVFELIDSIVLVTMLPLSEVKCITSPTRNSVKNKVPNPATTVPLFAIEKVPNS